MITFKRIQMSVFIKAICPFLTTLWVVLPMLFQPYASYYPSTLLKSFQTLENPLTSHQPVIRSKTVFIYSYSQCNIIITHLFINVNIYFYNFIRFSPVGFIKENLLEKIFKLVGSVRLELTRELLPSDFKSALPLQLSLPYSVCGLDYIIIFNKDRIPIVSTHL